MDTDETISDTESMEIPPDPLEPSGNVSLCNTRRKNTQIHEIRPASPEQFPFMVAILSPRNEYVCAGSIIANGLILTTAKCTESISHVLLNTTNDKKDDSTISLHIIKSESFPTYTGPKSTKDVAVIYTQKHNSTIATKINLSNLTFLHDLNEMEAIGFGLNADVGQVKELQYVGLDARDTKQEEIVGFIDCIDTKVPTCFKDKGGPIIVNNELVGLITRGEDECTNEIMSTYAINKRMIDALPIYVVKSWLDEKIAKHTEQGEEALQSYPKKPVLRMEMVHKLTSSGDINKIMHLCYVLMLFILSFF
ncbi:jg26783 [Pararge aegeria aegeria]|uniref:Jg26783 protein n=2 Tax=Pararge aegeria TaxID=116150 RepID=A0A8S4SBW2_9NEOP|nr:jg26783 [Pararge aegeria aegeria]